MTEGTAAMSPEEFRRWITDHGYTQETLADALHINRTSIYKWLNDRHPVTRTVKLALDHLISGRKIKADPKQTMSGVELTRWMRANAFDDDLLGGVLDVHPLSVARWRNEVHPISYPLRLALERIAFDQKAFTARQHLFDVERIAKDEAKASADAIAKRQIEAARRRAVQATQRA